MARTIKKKDLVRLVEESANDIFRSILNEGYSSVDAKSDLNIVGAYICGLGVNREHRETPTRKEAMEAYVRFTNKFWKKLEIFD